MITLIWHFNCATDCNNVRLRLILETLCPLVINIRNKTKSKMGVVVKKKSKGQKGPYPLVTKRNRGLGTPDCL